MNGEAIIERAPGARALANKLIDEVYVYIEGESDKRYWQNVFVKGTHISACGGCDDVIETVISANERKAKCFGIIDRDFRCIIPTDKECPTNVFITDDHDIEAMMYKTDALERIIIGSHYSIEEADIEILRDYILSITNLIAYLKIANERNQLKVKFKKPKKKNASNDYSSCFEYPKYESVLEIKKWRAKNEISEKKLIEVVMKFNNTINKSQLLCDAFIDEKQHIYDKWLISNGHDFTYLLMHILKNGQTAIENMDTIEEKLYLAYNHLPETKLYKSIVGYCHNNGIHIMK